MPMDLRITKLAKKRMEKYGISESLVRDAMDDPDSIVEGHSGRKYLRKNSMAMSSE